MHETSPHRPISEDVSAQHPLDAATDEVLHSFNVSEPYLHQYGEQYKRFTAHKLDELGVAIDLSREASLNPVPGVHQTSPDRGEYAKIRHDPIKKFNKDAEIALGYLQGLGPTNSLRQNDGHDAVFELAHIKRLLQNDYEALPDGNDPNQTENQRKPERRMAEALVTEELALLWDPKALAKAQTDSTLDETIANPSDRNVLVDQQMELPPEHRWVLIGAKLCEEATEIYDEIYKSTTAGLETRVAALTRGTDMKLRAIQLRLAVEKNKNTRAYYEETFQLLTRKHAQLVSDQWIGLLNKFDSQDKDPTEEQQNLLGLLFECNVVAKERLELLREGKHHKVGVRLAMPREDNIEKSIKPLWTRDNMKVNLSSDVVIETIGGKRLKTIQAKGMKQATYDDRAQRSQPIIYPKELIEMRFLDSPGYENLLRH